MILLPAIRDNKPLTYFTQNAHSPPHLLSAGEITDTTAPQVLTSDGAAGSKGSYVSEFGLIAEIGWQSLLCRCSFSCFRWASVAPLPAHKRFLQRERNIDRLLRKRQTLTQLKNVFVIITMFWCFKFNNTSPWVNMINILHTEENS